jgi:hypothetical protein
MPEQYVIVYEWLLRHPELTRFEALIICEVMRWPSGCHKSSASIAKLFKSDTRTIQRIIKSLRLRQWLAILPDRKSQERTLFATPKEPPLGPLFEYREKTMQKITKALIERTSKQLTLWK